MDMGRGCRTPSEQSWWGNRLSEARLSWAVASLVGAWATPGPCVPVLLGQALLLGLSG